MKREDVLEKAYRLGFKYEGQYTGCTQCTIAAVFEALNMKVDDGVFRAGTGLAGGLGLTGFGVCGALIGGAMVISYLHPRTYDNFADPKGEKWKSYRLVKELVERFIREYGSCLCRDVQMKLFGRAFNLWDPKDFKEFEKLGAFKDKCTDVVGKTAMWTVDVLLNAKNILEEEKE